jgi:4-hydroxy-3-methylbut-2-enyl diphosphate reductase
VDLGGVDGLLHISEMSWSRISHPREMFREGSKIQVMVLRLDKDAGKISLGHRQVLPDPWNLVRQNYRQGQKLTVRISRLVQSGAFVKLPEGAEAFLPVSEMSIRRIRKPSDAVEEAQEVEVMIIDLKPDERRMVLSMRALGAGAAPPSSAPSGFVDEDREGRRTGKKKKKGRSRQDDEELEDFIGRRGFSGAGITIGERLGMLKGFGSRDETEDAESHEEPASEPTAEATAATPEGELAPAANEGAASSEAGPEAEPLSQEAAPEPEVAEGDDATAPGDAVPEPEASST